MILALLLSLLPTASATQVGSHLVPCPLGGGTAHVYEKLAADSSGGYDSDLAAYASGGQWRAYAISSCDDNLFTLLGTDMVTPVQAADKDRLTQALADAVAKLPDRAHPEVWDRYRIAAALYTAMKKDDAFLGDLFLHASWTARDAAVGFYAGLQGPMAARDLIDAGRKELQKPLSAADRGKILYNLARVAHRGGWGAERDAFLDQFEKNGGLDDASRTALARFRKIAHEIEPGLQDEAIAHYVTALRTELPHEEKARISYTLADLLRRRGREKEAVTLYFLVANDQKVPDDTMRSMAAWFAKQLTDKLDPR
jgi:tetratricopeptide (TPR) repeat protein